MRKFLILLMAPLWALKGQMMTVSLIGSPYALERQNAVADQDNLSRLKNLAEVERFRRAGLLVPIPDGEFGLRVHHLLRADRRFCRPWTVEFLKEIGVLFEKEFGKPLFVTSCVRDVHTQTRLIRRNGNAAPAAGPNASSHLTGSTADVNHRGLTETEKAFVRKWLEFYESKGVIEATEEKLQPVWHVMVFKSYTAS